MADDNLQFRVDSLSKEEWCEASKSFEHHNLYQTWDYAAIHSPESSTRGTLRCGLFAGEEPRVLGQFRVKRIPVLGLAVAELEWGPLWRPEAEEQGLEEVRKFLNGVRREIGERRKWEVRIYPHTAHPYGYDERIEEILIETGFEKVLTGTHNYDTVILDLAQDLDTLRSDLHQKWRNLLKKAEKSNLAVETGRDHDYFDRFLTVYEAMREVKEFPTGVRLPMIRKMQEALPEDDRFLVSIATEEGRDVGATVCAVAGKRMLYFLGATDPSFRGDAPGYLLQWRNIQSGKELGLHWYDLGGLVSEGVTRFKVRMGGTQVSFPRRFVASPGKLRSKAFEFAESAIQRIKR